MLGVSAIFHNLGPALAVLLFAHLDVLGVAWLRIVGAAAVFAVWRRPWRAFRRRSWPAPVRLGVVLALMNIAFYLAIARLPLATVSAIEFLGVVALAAAGSRSRRNLVALGLAVAGVGLLTELRLVGEPLGFGYAFANLGLFVCYLVFAHRIANHRAASRWGGIDQLGAAMLVAAVVATPFGVDAGSGALVEPGWLLAGAGVGICSSVVPYVLDQVVMARMPRATFALLLSLLPAWATIIGAVVLGQRPTAQDLAGVALVAVAVALHQSVKENDGTGTSGIVRPEGLADLPRDDELRRPGQPGVDPAGRSRRADRTTGGGARRDVLRHRRHVLGGAQ